MAQKARLIKAVGLGDGPATAAASRAGEGTFDRQDEFALRVDLSLEHTDIRDIERDRNKWLLVHVRSSFPFRCVSWRDCASVQTIAQPLHLGASTASPGEPVFWYRFFALRSENRYQKDDSYRSAEGEIGFEDTTA